MCTTAELFAYHGTPEKFERAVWRAYLQGFVTMDEALDAIGIYYQEWLDASNNVEQAAQPTGEN